MRRSRRHVPAVSTRNSAIARAPSRCRCSAPRRSRSRSSAARSCRCRSIRSAGGLRIGPGRWRMALLCAGALDGRRTSVAFYNNRRSTEAVVMRAGPCSPRPGFVMSGADSCERRETRMRFLTTVACFLAARTRTRRYGKRANDPLAQHSLFPAEIGSSQPESAAVQHEVGSWKSHVRIIRVQPAIQGHRRDAHVRLDISRREETVGIVRRWRHRETRYT